MHNQSSPQSPALHHLICLLFWGVFANLAHAASFDCAKAATVVEKTICADAFLSQLDDTLGRNYKNMLSAAVSNQASDLRRNQVTWLAARNKCADAACIAGLYQKRLSELAVADLLYGSWEGGDTAAMSIYGMLHISEGAISWGRDVNRPRCKTGYTLIAEPAGVIFKNQIGKEFITGPNARFQSFLLKIRQSKCTGDLGYLRLTIEPSFSLDYLSMVEYSPEHSEQGWMHFHKR